MQKRRYPKIGIRSKNELAKRISTDKFPFADALALINDVLANFDKYWRDNLRKSEPSKDKFVRSAAGAPLGTLLRKINMHVLGVHDNLLPNFVFCGVSGSNHAKAAAHLIGKKRRRTFLKADIKRFFEHVTEARVAQLLQIKCGCSRDAAKLIARLCCVPVGAKGSLDSRKTIGRGFATSSRLAVWTNLDIFLRVSWMVQKRLAGKDAEIAIYVDDIGISAARTSIEQMEEVYGEMKTIMESSDGNQPLPLHDGKKKITPHSETPEHLGLRIMRNKLRIGKKSHGKYDHIQDRLKKTTDEEEKRRLRAKLRSMRGYKGYIEKTKK